MYYLLALLLVAACILGLLGAMMLSQATMGVGFIALGCLAGVLARIAQASLYRNERFKR